MYQRRKSVAFFIALCLMLACFAEAGTVFAEEAAFSSLNTNLTGLEVISGNWFADENGICGGNAGGGNCFVMSDVRTAAGLAFGIADKQNPEGHWCAFNVDVTEERNLARVFFVSEGELIASSNVTLPDDFNPAESAAPETQSPAAPT